MMTMETVLADLSGIATAGDNALPYVDAFCRSYWSMPILHRILPNKGGSLPLLPLTIAKWQGSLTIVHILSLHEGVYNYLP